MGDTESGSEGVSVELEFLPEPGRGTSRRLVEGGMSPALHRPPSTALRAVPLPASGEDF